MTKRAKDDSSIARRRILAGLGAALSSAAIGCGGDSITVTSTAAGVGGAGGAGSAGGNGGAGGVGGSGGSGGAGGGETVDM